MLKMARTIILSKKILRNLKVQAAHNILCYQRSVDFEKSINVI